MAEGSSPAKNAVDCHLPAACWRRGVRGRRERRTLLADAGEGSRLRMGRSGSGNAAGDAGKERAWLRCPRESFFVDARISANARLSEKTGGSFEGRRESH